MSYVLLTPRDEWVADEGVMGTGGSWAREPRMADKRDGALELSAGWAGQSQRKMIDRGVMCIVEGEMNADSIAKHPSKDHKYVLRCVDVGQERFRLHAEALAARRNGQTVAYLRDY